jgi:flagellar biosynthesis protein FlhF
MEVKTYCARTMQEALALVRRELGPSAAVLHTREVGGHGLLGWISGGRRIEVTASTGVCVPSRLPPVTRRADPQMAQPAAVLAAPSATAAAVADEGKTRFREELKGQLTELQAMVEDLCRRSQRSSSHDLPEELFHLYTDLIEAELSEELARELVERVRDEAPAEELPDQAIVRSRVTRMIEEQIQAAGPIRLVPGQRRLVALVGPTGVGKTTTIAKLAANFRLREKRRVGLITVDTYRIAAVEQLRTYADIIDLPMQVVSTPKEMREAIHCMGDLDLVLMDTAGRSPKDEVKIQELKAFLAEAQADEVHLVLSSVAGAATLERTAERFAAVGTTHLVLTKLDEASGLGNLLPLLRGSGLPLSYLTNGQNVPDDIEPAERRRFARLILGEPCGRW